FRTGLGDLPLTDELRRTLEAADAPRNLIVGIRPEHFEDAALLEEHQRSRGAVFSAEVDVLESMGSDKFAYFSVEGEQAMSDDLADLAADAGTADVPGGDASTLVTRLSATSSASEGQRLEVWVDTTKIQVFDAASGRNLPTAAPSPVAAGEPGVFRKATFTKQRFMNVAFLKVGPGAVSGGACRSAAARSPRRPSGGCASAGSAGRRAAGRPRPRCGPRSGRPGRASAPPAGTPRRTSGGPPSPGRGSGAPA